jgi:hypothetical protein
MTSVDGLNMSQVMYSRVQIENIPKVSFKKYILTADF